MGGRLLFREWNGIAPAQLQTDQGISRSWGQVSGVTIGIGKLIFARNKLMSVRCNTVFIIQSCSSLQCLICRVCVCGFITILPNLPPTSQKRNQRVCTQATPQPVALPSPKELSRRITRYEDKIFYKNTLDDFRIGINDE